jgi:hypothetical protein
MSAEAEESLRKAIEAENEENKEQAFELYPVALGIILEDYKIEQDEGKKAGLKRVAERHSNGIFLRSTPALEFLEKTLPLTRGVKSAI